MIMQQGIPHFAVSDVAASIQFYQNILGFTVRQLHAGKETTIQWAVLERGNVEILLTDRAIVERMPDMIQSTSTSQITYILSNGVEEFFERIRRQVQVMSTCVRTFRGTKEFRIADPDGYLLSFFEEAG